MYGGSLLIWLAYVAKPMMSKADIHSVSAKKLHCMLADP